MTISEKSSPKMKNLPGRKTAASRGTDTALQSPAADPVHQDPWQELKRFTHARIALGRAGVSIPTKAHLEFQLAHAVARDAVLLPIDTDLLFKEIKTLGLPLLELTSRVADRQEYLVRPDRGRRLSAESVALLKRQETPADQGVDVAIVVADGLSTAAVQRQAVPFLNALLPRLQEKGYVIAPISYVHMGRVAVGDEVGELLNARVVAVLIGERPGLSSPDSLGVYMTYDPAVGLTDERRNCISNIRPQGQSFEQAAQTLEYLLSKSMEQKISGVHLKDDQILPGDESPSLEYKDDPEKR